MLLILKRWLHCHLTDVIVVVLKHSCCKENESWESKNTFGSSLSWRTSATKFKCLNFTLPNFLSGANMPKNEISMQKVENWKCESFVTFIIYHQQHGLKFWTLKFKTFLILSMELNLITIKSTVVCLCWKRRPNETVQNDRYFVAH